MTDKYDDILHLPHHVSQKHPQMSMQERAAQFSPFAALTGYGDAIQETARLTDAWIEVDEGEKEEAGRRLHRAEEEQLPVCITYYVPDERKAGGAYVTVAGTVKKLDEYTGTVKMAGGEAIPIHQIYAVEGEAFERET